MENELISVIIPTYKRNDTLERALRSVKNQTYKNIEIIVVDDNAKYPEIRLKNREIINKFNDIKFIENTDSLGGGISRNKGIEIAKGRFIAFLDDDDEFLPKKIEMQYNLYKKLNNNNIAVIYCYANMIRTDGSVYERKVDFEGTPIIENVKNCIAATSWWFCDKEKLKSVGCFENISSRQDASLLLKLLLKGYEIYRVPEVLLNYYWHDANSGISKTDLKSLEAEKKYFEIFKNSIPLEMNWKVKKEICFLFLTRIALLEILLERKKDAFYSLKEMFRLRKFDINNFRVIFGIVFNKTYKRISFERNKKRVQKG